MSKKQEGSAFDYGFEDRTISGTTPNTHRPKRTAAHQSAGHTHVGAVGHVAHGNVNAQHNSTHKGDRKQKM